MSEVRRRDPGEGAVVRLSDGHYRAILDLGFVEGKRRRKWGPRTKTKRQSLDWLRDKQRAQRTGVLVAREVTVATWFRTYLDEIARPKVRPSTFVNYERDFRRHIEPSLGRLRLSKLEPQHLVRLYADKLETGLSPASVRHIHATMRRALAVAMRWQLVGRNVAQLVEPPTREHFEVSPLTLEECQALLAAAADDRMEARWVVALSLGLRQGETLGLWWEDVDLAAGLLRVRRQLNRMRVAGEAPSFGPLKTARSRRTLVLPEPLVASLRRHRERQAAERAAARVWSDPRLVFATPIGTPVDPSNDARAFQVLLKRAGVRRVRLHDLRHTAASLLLAQGLHPRVVMEVLGHSQIALTMNTYGHVMPSLLGEAARSMETALWGEKS